MEIEDKSTVRRTSITTIFCLNRLPTDLWLIWHSEDCGSWHILIMKANQMHCFSNLFG